MNSVTPDYLTLAYDGHYLGRFGLATLFLYNDRFYACFKDDGRVLPLTRNACLNVLYS